ncbi:uncharacterized protein LOC144439783 [Glandiceps talaboti]
MESLLKSPSDQCRLIVVYRPPPSTKNKSTTSSFLEEFTDFLSTKCVSPGKLLITGDFNLHLDDENNRDTCQFKNMLDSVNLTQHVQQATHQRGHMLDLVITRTSENTVEDIKISDPVISDHFAVSFKIPVTKPKPTRKILSSRKITDINIEDVCTDIQNSPLITRPSSVLTSLIDQYDESLRNILDTHAPIRQRTVIMRPNIKWYNDEIRDAKRKRRLAERNWRRTKLTIHRQIYKSQCLTVNQLIHSAKINYYRHIIQENGNNQKALFNVVNKLLHKSKEMQLPSHTSTEEIAERFSNFFVDKIKTIRVNLQNQACGNYTTNQSTNDASTKLVIFEPTNEDELRKIITRSPNKSCNLDPIPTSILKQVLDDLLPSLVNIVNLSLSTGCVPDKLKTAIVKPLLKKQNLDPEIMKNYRPVSNLSFLSKTIEKVVATRINDHLHSNKLDETMQSAYKTHHSTETALLRVQNDILSALDNGKIVMMVLLDLSAAFDTVDHSILISRLQNRMGITGTALSWIESYLRNRQQTTSK